MTENEYIFWSVAGIAIIVWFTYKATKIGMVDEAMNFIKYEIFKRKRP